MNHRDPIWRLLSFQGRTKQWLAAKTGYAPAYVRAVAAGQEKPSAEFQDRCARALDVPMDLLFTSQPQGDATQDVA